MTSQQRAQQLEERLIQFAIRLVRVSDRLPNSYSGQHFGKQIVRSGSAPALLYAEARGAESDADFKHKCSLVLKELRETYVNLKIISGAEHLKATKLEELLRENNELISIFVATVRTVKAKLLQLEAAKKAA